MTYNEFLTVIRIVKQSWSGLGTKTTWLASGQDTVGENT